MTREDAIKTLYELRRETNDTWYEEVYNMAIEALKTIDNCDQCEWCCPLDGTPTISVVRCKDCDRGFGSPVCPIQSQGWAINKDTFFCAWGERRGEVM